MNPETSRFLDRYAGGRRDQEAQIIQAVRGLFDEHGLRDPSIGEIAKAVGINKATIYRHVASKEELFLLVLASYQQELDLKIREVDESLDPLSRLDGVLERYIAFCLRYPGYLDCVGRLTFSPFPELAARVSGGALLTVGGSMAAVNSRFAQVIATGKEQGVFKIDDPDRVAHLAYSAIIGVMQMLRLGAAVQLGPTGFPEIIPIDNESTTRLLLTAVHRMLGAPAADDRPSTE